jgi:uncharacterized protein (DUF2062 family)
MHFRRRQSIGIRENSHALPGPRIGLYNAFQQLRLPCLWVRIARHTAAAGCVKDMPAAWLTALPACAAACLLMGQMIAVTAAPYVSPPSIPTMAALALQVGPFVPVSGVLDGASALLNPLSPVDAPSLAVVCGVVFSLASFHAMRRRRSGHRFAAEPAHIYAASEKRMASAAGFAPLTAESLP